MVLFNRVKTCSVIELNSVLLEVRGVFIDSFHEINLTIHVDHQRMEIVWARAYMLKTPHADCVEAESEGSKLVGIKIGSGVRKAILDAVGHAHGCTHLADLALDAVKAVIQANFKLQYKKQMPPEQLLAKYIDELAGTCHHWTILGERVKSCSERADKQE